VFSGRFCRTVFSFFDVKDNKPGITKVKWEKIDKEWYEVILRENISSIKHKLSLLDFFPATL
jgi:hypothetical protein